MKVAVIGAGAGGLVSARELLREAHEVCVFEQSNQVGGAWVHDSETEDDPLGIQPVKSIHSSLYDSLRTNLPRDLMAFMDYSFDSHGGGDDHWERYPHHNLVLEYLKSFSQHFNIHPLIVFDQRVTNLEVAGDNQWRIKTASGIDECFDAVSVCNGHYTLPYVPELDGASNFKGFFLHSHNYRNPQPFSEQSVAILGAASSGADISREVATVAKKVFWCGEQFNSPTEQVNNGLSRHPIPQGFNQQGELLFRDSAPVSIDSFIFCTGYRYEFSFIGHDIISVTDNQVRPLHMDLVHPAHPTLSFIGLPYLIIPFPLFEMQARWFARLLTGSHQLPTETKMIVDLVARRSDLTKTGSKDRHYHRLGEEQFSYINKLASQCGDNPLPEWYELLAREVQQARFVNPEHYRSVPLHYSGTTVV